MIPAWNQARSMIESAASIVAFTGAGISQESGIPTYRGADGVWQEYDPGKYADIDYFREQPEYYWSFFRDIRYPGLMNSRPNPAHLALSRLERHAKLSAVITQNIDGLHQQAGSTRVIELHGNARRIGCLGCAGEYDFRDIGARLHRQMPPRCDHCGGLLKPKVIFFGEAPLTAVMDSAARALSRCDLLLIVGTSLVVHPAAALPRIARANQAGVIIVKVGETALDGSADVCIDGRAGEVLPAICGSRDLP